MKIGIFGELLEVQDEKNTHFLKKSEVGKLKRTDITGLVKYDGVYRGEEEILSTIELDVRHTYSYYRTIGRKEAFIEEETARKQQQIIEKFMKLKDNQKVDVFEYEVRFENIGTININEEGFNLIKNWLSV